MSTEARVQGGPTRSNTRLFAVGALLVAGIAFVMIAAGGIGKNLVYYWGPTEVHAAGDKAMGATIRLGGFVKEGSIAAGAGRAGVNVHGIGRHAGLVRVRAAEVPPQRFRERIGVVVEGTMTSGGTFESRR